MIITRKEVLFYLKVCALLINLIKCQELNVTQPVPTFGSNGTNESIQELTTDLPTVLPNASSTPETAKASNSSTANYIWITIAVIYVILVVIGLIWTLKNFCEIKSYEEIEDKRVKELVTILEGQVSETSLIKKSKSQIDKRKDDKTVAINTKSKQAFPSSSATKVNQSTSSSPAE